MQQLLPQKTEVFCFFLFGSNQHESNLSLTASPLLVLSWVLPLVLKSASPARLLLPVRLLPMLPMPPAKLLLPVGMDLASCQARDVIPDTT